MSDLTRFLEMSLVGIRNSAFRQSLSGCLAEFRLAESLRQCIGKLEIEFSAAIRKFSSDVAGHETLLEERSRVYEAMFLSISEPSACSIIVEPLFLELQNNGLRIIGLLIQAQHFEGCEIEADHIHNLARYAERADRADYLGYLDVERTIYLKRFAMLTPYSQLENLHSLYLPIWRNLESTFNTKF